MGTRDWIASRYRQVAASSDGDRHAELITYTPVGGSATPIYGTVVIDSDVGLQSGPTGQYRLRTGRVMVSSADVTSPQEGDTITIDSEDWKVGDHATDRYGLVKLFINLQEKIETTHQGLRRQG